MQLKESIYKALENVYDPELNKSLIELNMIKDVIIEENNVVVVVSLTTAGCPLKSKIGNDIKDELGKIEGIQTVDVKFGEMTPEEKQKLIEKLHGPQRENPFKNTRVIAVGSGKAGVGKSTVTVNLAVTLSKLGHKVGLIDADIMGYSVPNILGIDYVRPQSIEGGLILPIEKDGIKVISMGNFAEENSPVIWRGPMLGKALQQFIYDVYWDELDFMLIDLPPGTGDVPLSLIQMMPEAELLIITTPQATAADVSKRLGMMAAKTKNKITGVIENMSYFICDNCGKEHFIFGKGQSEGLADELGTNLIGKIPMINIGETNIKMLDNPIIDEAYKEIADRILNS